MAAVPGIEEPWVILDLVIMILARQKGHALLCSLDIPIALGSSLVSSSENLKSKTLVEREVSVNLPRYILPSLKDDSS